MPAFVALNPGLRREPLAMRLTSRPFAGGYAESCPRIGAPSQSRAAVRQASRGSPSDRSRACRRGPGWCSCGGARGDLRSSLTELARVRRASRRRFVGPPHPARTRQEAASGRRGPARLGWSVSVESRLDLESEVERRAGQSRRLDRRDLSSLGGEGHCHAHRFTVYAARARVEK